MSSAIPSMLRRCAARGGLVAPLLLRRAGGYAGGSVAPRATLGMGGLGGCPSGWTMTRGFAALPTHEVLDMPALSPTMEQGNVASWVKAEGDKINAGDILAQIETDKATVDFDSQEDGYLAKVLVAAGTNNIPVGTPLCVLVEEAEDIAAFADYKAAAAPAAAAAAPAAAPSAPAAAPPAPAPAAPAAREPLPAGIKMGPAARILLQESGLSHTQITATGPRGILTKGDVLKAVASGMKPGAAPAKAAAAAAPAKAPAAGAPGGPKYTDIPNSNVRKIIAKRLLESKTTIPHMYVTGDACLDNVTALRAALKEQGVKVSVNDFVVRACAVALKSVPEANASWDVASSAPKPNDMVDIAIAVATEGGLITPIVRNADGKSLDDISAEVRSLAGKARDGKLMPDEYMGGTFSISNLGMFGVTEFSAIINPPQAAIMAVGTGVNEAVMRDGKLAASTKMTVTISADHRVWDGDTAGRFMAAFKGAMEEPALLMK